MADRAGLFKEASANNDDKRVAKDIYDLLAQDITN